MYYMCVSFILTVDDFFLNYLHTVRVYNEGTSVNFFLSYLHTVYHTD